MFLVVQELVVVGVDLGVGEVECFQGSFGCFAQGGGVDLLGLGDQPFLDGQALPVGEVVGQVVQGTGDDQCVFAGDQPGVPRRSRRRRTTTGTSGT
ncbi:hypothetical protein BJF82_11290 [Kytococcus sp. CUA-901]|nr:hypothetical protein BJF82_11290 [Kytococcus sp. CUA-901]